MNTGIQNATSPAGAGLLWARLGPSSTFYAGEAICAIALFGLARCRFGVRLLLEPISGLFVQATRPRRSAADVGKVAVRQFALAERKVQRKASAFWRSSFASEGPLGVVSSRSRNLTVFTN